MNLLPAIVAVAEAAALDVALGVSSLVIGVVVVVATATFEVAVVEMAIGVVAAAEEDTAELVVVDPLDVAGVPEVAAADVVSLLEPEPDPGFEPSPSVPPAINAGPGMS